MYQLFTDTDTDLTPEKAAEYGYEMISMPYAENGKDEVFPYVDFKTFEYHTFYDTLRNGVIPQTFALSPQKYIDYFEPYFKDGKDVLYVHFSAVMSGTFDALRLAEIELKKKYPERTLYKVDTKAITIGSYNIVCEIGKLAKNGATVEQILEWAKTEVDKFAVYFYADDLKFFAKSGRVSNFSASMGNLFGIRPILTMNSEGRMASIAKAKGRRGAVNKLLQFVRELKDDIKSYNVIIGHTDAYDQAIAVRDMLISEYGDDLKTEIVVVNPTAGSHCGPDTIGICFHAIHR
ncbi:MAG: DegV family protein [Clostridia bacterium]|nr:DegV family protein [Clostridia bacterium]